MYMDVPLGTRGYPWVTCLSAAAAQTATNRAPAAMESVVSLVARFFQESLFDYLDPRSEGWLLSRSILVPITIVSAYLYFVKRCGPRFMANRPPYGLKNTMIAYNILQIAANSYICIVGSHVWFSNLDSIFCQPVDHSVTEATELMARLVWYYYILKIADLVDTVFFVFRKKDSHISFLHVYHHVNMVFGGYVASRFFLNGHAYLLGIINTFVHAVLYSYYLLCNLRPETREATWKKYITVLQLAQFAILVVHNACPLLLGASCGVQKFWTAILVAQNVFMFVMFSDFYQKAYGSERHKKAA